MENSTTVASQSASAAPPSCPSASPPTRREEDLLAQIESLQALCKRHEEDAAGHANSFRTYVEEAERHATDLLMQMVAVHHEVQDLKQDKTGLSHRVASLTSALAANADCNGKLLQKKRLLEAQCDGLRRCCHRAKNIFHKLRGNLTRTGSDSYLLEGAGVAGLVEEVEHFEASMKGVVAAALRAAKVAGSRLSARRVKFVIADEGLGDSSSMRKQPIESVVHGAGEVVEEGEAEEEENELVVEAAQDHAMVRPSTPIPSSPVAGTTGPDDEGEDMMMAVLRYYDDHQHNPLDDDNGLASSVMAGSDGCSHQAPPQPSKPTTEPISRSSKPLTSWQSLASSSLAHRGTAVQGGGMEEDDEALLLHDLLAVSQRQRSLIKDATGERESLRARLAEYERALAHKDMEVQELHERNRRLGHALATLQGGGSGNRSGSGDEGPDRLSSSKGTQGGGPQQAAVS